MVQPVPLQQVVSPMRKQQSQRPRRGSPRPSRVLGAWASLTLVCVWAKHGWPCSEPSASATFVPPEMMPGTWRPGGGPAGRRGSVALAGGKVTPEPGETAKFLGQDADIPRQRFFNFLLWDNHRKNPERYVALSKGLFSRSTIVNRLRWPLWFLGIFVFIICFYDSVIVPRHPTFAMWNLPVTPFTISSPALGLLLVFRVNGSYARYTEGRLLWGEIVNRTRDLMQNAFQWFKDEDEIQKFCCYVALFPAALMCLLRRPDEHELKIELDRSLGARAELGKEAIDEVLNRPAGLPAPLFITNKLREFIQRNGVEKQERLVMENNITTLVAMVGACERVLGTPIPVAYTIHTARFLLMWLVLLPLSLVKELGWGTIPATLMLGYGLLGIEDVGIMLEEPFCVLPLEAICNKIAKESKAYRKASADRKAGKGVTMGVAAPKAISASTDVKMHSAVAK